MTEDSIKDNITLFDIKYNDATERLNSLILSEESSNSFSIKNFINIFRLELSQEKINSQNNSKSKSKNKNKNTIKRKKLLNVKEIPLKDKIAKQYYNIKYLNKEIAWYEIKQQEKIKNLIITNNKGKRYIYDPLMKEISKELDRNNSNFNKNYFSNSPINFDNNKLIRKIKIKKSNNSSLNNYSTLNSNIINSYNLHNELRFLSSDKNINSISKLAKDIKVNKSEKIYPIKKFKLKSDFNNILSRNLNHNKIIRKEDGEKNIEKNLSYKYLLNKYKIGEEMIADKDVDYY